MTRSPAELIERCRTDLAAIESDLRWAWAAAWWPATRALDSPRGGDLSRPEDERMAGPRYDLGIGDHAARVAYQRTGPRLAGVEADLHDAIRATGRRHGSMVPVLIVPDSHASPGHLLTVVLMLRWRLDALAVDIADVAGSPRTVAMRLLGRAATGLEHCASGLARAVGAGRGVDAEPVPMAWCATCAQRPRPLRDGKLDGKECRTCATWRARHGGACRPLYLDEADGSRHWPAKAAAQRAARGEGWGMA